MSSPWFDGDRLSLGGGDGRPDAPSPVSPTVIEEVAHIPQDAWERIDPLIDRIRREQAQQQGDQL